MLVIWTHQGARISIGEIRVDVIRVPNPGRSVELGITDRCGGNMRFSWHQCNAVINIGPDVQLKVLRTRAHEVRVAIDAPREMRVDRDANSNAARRAAIDSVAMLTPARRAS